MVIVLDRPEPGVGEFARKWWNGRLGVKPEFVEIVGKRGWRGPAIAWNTGFDKVTSELSYLISSEVIQEPDNCKKAVELLSGPPAVVFGWCKDDGEIPIVTGIEPNVLCSTKIRRPLGFIWAMPTWLLRMTHGMDLAYMRGFWFDDDDFTYRIWRWGVPYIFDDSIRGIHQHHDRKDLDTPEGKLGILKNQEYIRSRWHSEHPWDVAPKEFSEGHGRAIAFSLTEAPELCKYFDDLVGTDDISGISGM